MAFEDLKNNVDQIHDESKAYLETSIEYYKLWGFKVAMKSSTMLVKFIIISICVVMILTFASLAAAFAIGSALESTSLGFLIIAGFYLVVLILVFFFKSRKLEKRMLQNFSDIFFND